jgi:hypothetical protein
MDVYKIDDLEELIFQIELFHDNEIDKDFMVNKSFYNFYRKKDILVTRKMINPEHYLQRLCLDNHIIAFDDKVIK